MIRLRNAFSDERSFYRLLLIVGGVIAVLKGMHMPYSWPATQAQIDYRYGFLRRGLFGEVCRQLHIPIWRYGVFSFVSFVLLTVLFLLLAWGVRRSGLDEDGWGAFSALIAGSFVVSFLMNVIGFYDIVMAILVLVVLLMRRPGLQLVTAAVAGVVGVLVHELYAIAFLPVSLMGAVCWADAVPGSRDKLKRWVGVAAAALVPWVIVFAIAHRAEMTSAQGLALKAAIRARVNFEPYDAMLEVLTFSSRDNVNTMLSMLRVGSWWVEEILGALAFLPAAGFFLAVAWRFVSGRSWLVKVWLVGAVVAPLLLNFMGFDRYRWLMMVALNAMLAAVGMAFAQRGSERPVFGVGWRRAAVFLLMINLATDVGFFEGRARNFPFRDYWVDYRQSKEAGRPVLDPPELFPKR